MTKVLGHLRTFPSLCTGQRRIIIRMEEERGRKHIYLHIKKLCEPAALSRCMQLRTRYVGEDRLQRYPCTEGPQNRAPDAGHVGDVDICFLIRTDGAASTRRDWPGSSTRGVGGGYPCTSLC